jgi:hypothetical protein
MAALVWKHGTTRSAARQAVVSELRRLGYDSKVTWNGDAATASVGWGTVLSASGVVTDDAVILDRCSGAIGGVVLDKCREIMQRLFPHSGQS